MKILPLVRQAIIVSVFFIVQVSFSATETINLYADQAGHVWAGAAGQFDKYVEDLNIGQEPVVMGVALGTSRAFCIGSVSLQFPLANLEWADSEDALSVF